MVIFSPKYGYKYGMKNFIGFNLVVFNMMYKTSIIVSLCLFAVSLSAPTSDLTEGSRSVRSSRKCPQNMDKSIKEPKCYLFVPSQKSFVDAQAYCQSQGGNLAAVKNGFDNHLLADHGRTKFNGMMLFLGASVINSESNTWSWPDESELKFTNWLTPGMFTFIILGK